MTTVLPARTRLLNDSGYGKRLTTRQMAALYGRTPEVIAEEWNRQSQNGFRVFHVPAAWRQRALERVDLFLTETGKDTLTDFVAWIERREAKARASEPAFSG